MDFLRSFNITYSRMVDGSGRLFWVRWYPAAPGAKVFPHFHAFGHPVWEDSRDNFEGVGCIYSGLRWRRNRYPAPPGLSFRGEPEWFLDGLPPEQLAAPETGERCGVPAILPSGGCVLDGTAYLTLVVSTACQCEVADTIVGPLLSTACQCEVADTIVGPGPWITSTACQCEVADTIVGPGPWITSTACQCEVADTATSAPPAPIESVADQSEDSVSTAGVHSVASQVEDSVSTPSIHSVASQVEDSVSTPSIHSVASQVEDSVSTPSIHSVASQVEDVVSTATINDTTDGCSQAVPSPLAWKLTFAGGTGTFAALNGDWTLTYVSGCQWAGSGPVFGGLPTTLSLFYSFPLSAWRIPWTPFGSSAEWRHAPGGWINLGPNTLTLFSHTGSGTPPATAVVTMIP